MKAIIRAARFAAEKHSKQRRKNADATPYINHPLEVAEILAVEGQVDDLELLTAALLHDTIEDTTARPEEIATLFGDRVLAWVREVTDDKSLPKAERKQRQIDHAPTLSPGAKQLKLADKIANLRSVAGDPPQDWPMARQVEYFEWAGNVCRGLRGVNARLDELFTRVHTEGLERVKGR
jgi:GTP diphosphokinase / guanosine-3',5'-bis(diphosphate) 3'-diphosphatase